jgi:hypothetical protein
MGWDVMVCAVDNSVWCEGVKCGGVCLYVEGGCVGTWLPPSSASLFIFFWGVYWSLNSGPLAC